MTSNLSAEEVLERLPRGSFVRLAKVRPVGSLQAKKQPNGRVYFYWRSTIAYVTRRIPIGVYDHGAAVGELKSMSKGLSIAAAFHEASRLAQVHLINIRAGGYPAILAKERDAQRAAAEALKETQRDALRGLLEEYCDYLESKGSSEHKNVRSAFKCHVFEAWPRIAALPPDAVTSKQLGAIIRRAVELGKLRIAETLEQSMRAAFELARSPEIGGDFAHRFNRFNRFNVIENPVPVSLRRSRK